MVGVYLSFATAREPMDPMGPYDEIVVRGARVVGETSGLGQVIAVRGSKGEWLDAEGTSPSGILADPNAGLEVRAEPGVIVRSDRMWNSSRISASEATKLILVGGTPASFATRSISRRTKLYASAMPHNSWRTPAGVFERIVS